MRFKTPRKYSGERRLDASELDRRASAVRAAHAALATPADAIAFLNATHAELGGRPLDLATQSEPGLADVMALLRRSPQAADA